MNRDEMLAHVARRRDPWDIAVIGGGATGMGIAVDAASRGYAVVLLEQHDFGKGTSSRSTKLVHGGVRYLQQGNISLVREALRERSLLRRNAPHLVTRLPLIVPAYDWWERPYYGIGLRIYDLLARDADFGRSTVLSRADTLRRLPTLQPDGLRGGILYHDGQFDDARLLVNLARTAAEHGARLLNYAPVSSVSTTAAGAVDGLVARDLESGRDLQVAARIVINATGAFVDAVRALSDPGASPLIVPSQGTHVVLPREVLPGETAVMVPRTGDGRVVFAIPWRGHTLVGTTDTPVPQAELEPRPLAAEVDFLLRTVGRYLQRAPGPADVRSVFTGVRPLVGARQTRVTAALSRDHTIHVDPSGLVTTTGGKWTTYRRMAEETVDRAAAIAGLPQRPSITSSLKIHGYDTDSSRHGALAPYGADAAGIAAVSAEHAGEAEPLHPALTVTPAEVRWHARYEMARTVEDVLARRARTLFLDAKGARAIAPQVARILAEELGRDAQWERDQVDEFSALADAYSLRV